VTIPTEGRLIRIFIGETDRWEGRPLYEAIVLAARKRGMAGATVLKGFMGFGAHSRIHTAKLLELSQDLPIIVELVDAPGKIDAFMPELEIMVGDGLITLERAEVLVYRPRRDADTH
jgi:PII-like signaling protein